MDRTSEQSDVLRRRIGLGFLATALLLLILGLTVLGPILGKGLGFIFYWLACFAFTGLALLNAVLDLIIVRSRARREQSQMFNRALGKDGHSDPAP